MKPPELAEENKTHSWLCQSRSEFTVGKEGVFWVI
jgi:hypothetical protein